jgi:CheY-like chemotaxis protein
MQHDDNPLESAAYESKSQRVLPLDHVIVIVVDDERPSRERASAVLRAAGAAVMPAGSAREAFDVLDALLPDVIVSSVDLPRLSGCDLMEVVRTDPRTAAIPSVAVMPGSEFYEAEQAYTSGFDFLLTTPFEASTLVETVATAAGRGVRPA